MSELVVCGWLWIQEPTPTKHVFKTYWTACSKCAKYSRFKSQQNWGMTTYDMKFSTLIMNFDYEANGYKHDLGLLFISQQLWLSCLTRSGHRERSHKL